MHLTVEDDELLRKVAEIEGWTIIPYEIDENGEYWGPKGQK